MPFAPTIYKLPGAGRHVPCMVCLTLHTGPTTACYLGYGVVVYLCAAHASREFRRSRGGRDHLLTLSRAFAASGCLTRNRARALDALFELERRRDTEPPPVRPRPGSYAWPELRRLVEQACARGIVSLSRLRRLIEDHLRSELRRGRIRLPSDRTLRRWRVERRWELDSTPTPP